MRIDLGTRHLVPEWRRLFSKRLLKNDFLGGITAACLALPLSLAFGMASGVAPATGLFSSIVLSVICGLFGSGSRTISGPAAAMAIILGSIVQEHGLSGLAVVGVICGCLQVLTGMMGLGQVFRLVPFPVIAGFSAGMGAILLIGQVPTSLGLSTPLESQLLQVVIHIRDLADQMQFGSLLLAGGTLAIAFILPQIFPMLPAPFIALVVPSLVVGFLQLPFQTVGHLTEGFVFPSFPLFTHLHWSQLLGPALVFYILASMESLLVSRAVDKLTKAKHDPDQELIGQGLGNFVSSFLGGIPGTAVIGRTALSIHAGSETRRSSFFFAAFLVLVFFFASPLIDRIPVAVLAGILISVGLRMMHPREFLVLWRSSREEALVYLVTFLVVVSVDLTVGVQSGLIATIILVAIGLGRNKTNVHVLDTRGPTLIAIEGPLTFLSSSKMDSVRSSKALRSPSDLERGLIVDMSAVTAMDASGARSWVELIEFLLNLKAKFAIRGLSPKFREVIFDLDLEDGLREGLARHVASNEVEVGAILGKAGVLAGLDKLLYGVEQFRSKSGYLPLFRALADQQSPHTLFITCSDSRIDPNLITSTEPGELFIVRNVGNIVPPFGTDDLPAEGAAVEFALGVLGVKEIVVCGHSGCGAMKALISDNFFSEENRLKFPSLVNWLKGGKALKAQLPQDATPAQAARFNALLQTESQRTYPMIQDKLKKRELRISAWYYNIGDAELEQWDETQRIFVSVGSRSQRSLEKRVEAGIQYQVPKA